MEKFEIQIGINNPILRKKSNKILVFDDELKKIEKALKKFLIDKNGVGIAAPQIGIHKRIILCNFDEKTLITMCNPEILYTSKKIILSEEGCLSLPGIWGKVNRPDKILVKYQDIKGKNYELQLTKFNARIVLHEIDHLNGILFYEKISGEFTYQKDTNLAVLGIEE